MGTGCDTILAQMAAECLDCDIDHIVVFGADTDISPYDSGSYASSTTYVTGKAVEQACEKLKNNLCDLALQTFHCEKEDVEFTSQGVKNLKTNELLTLKDLALKAMCGNNIETQVTVTHSSPVSPPPCGTVINTNLARVQTEGGLVQGIGMALYEDVQYTKRGAIPENSFMQYKIPTRLDMGKIRVEFESSYEPTGPFGAKSIGEIVINTPSPAIANAIYRATGKYLKDLPMTPEKILMAIDE